MTCSICGKKKTNLKIAIGDKMEGICWDCAEWATKIMQEIAKIKKEKQS